MAGREGLEVSLWSGELIGGWLVLKWFYCVVRDV
jgi:hypothetical protein